MQAEKKVARVELGPRSTLMLDRFSAPNMTSFVGFSALLPRGKAAPPHVGCAQGRTMSGSQDGCLGGVGSVLPMETGECRCGGGRTVAGDAWRRLHTTRHGTWDLGFALIKSKCMPWRHSAPQSHHVRADCVVTALPSTFHCTPPLVCLPTLALATFTLSQVQVVTKLPDTPPQDADVCQVFSVLAAKISLRDPQRRASPCLQQDEKEKKEKN